MKQCLHLQYTEKLREGLLIAAVFNWWQRHEHDTVLTLHTGNMLWVVTALLPLVQKESVPTQHVLLHCRLISTLSSQKTAQANCFWLVSYLQLRWWSVYFPEWKMSKYLKSTRGLQEKMAPAAITDIPVSLQLWQWPKDPWWELCWTAACAVKLKKCPDPTGTTHPYFPLGSGPSCVAAALGHLKLTCL